MITTPAELAAVQTAQAAEHAAEPTPCGIAIELHGVDRAAFLYGQGAGMEAACAALIAERPFCWFNVHLDQVAL